MSWLNLKSLSPPSNITSCSFRGGGGGGGMSGRGHDLFPLAWAGSSMGGGAQDFTIITPSQPLWRTHAAHSNPATALLHHVTAIMWPREPPPPMCNKMSFYLHSTRRKLNQKQGAGSRRSLLRAKLVLLWFRGFDSVSEGGGMGGWAGGHEAKCMMGK